MRVNILLCTSQNSPVEFFWTYEFSKVQGFLVDLASHGVPEEI